MDNNKRMKQILFDTMFRTKRDARRSINNINYCIQNYKMNLKEAFVFESEPYFGTIHTCNGNTQEEQDYAKSLTINQRREICAELYTGLESQLKKIFNID